MEIHAFTHAFYARVFKKMQTFQEAHCTPWPTLRRQPKDSVEQFQGMLQDIDDEAVRKLARQIGTNPEEEPYEGGNPGQEPCRPCRGTNMAFGPLFCDVQQVASVGRSLFAQT
jgi:hypothetical protein